MFSKYCLPQFNHRKTLLFIIPIILLGLSVHLQAKEKEILLGTFLKFPGLYDNQDSPLEKKQAIRKALANIHASGLNTVMPYIIGSSGNPLYPSQIVPSVSANKNINNNWDPLQFVIEEAPKYQLKVYPTVCVLVCGHHHLRGILKIHPEWALQNPEGGKLGFISCANPEARKWIISVLKEITDKYQPDGIMLDYLRFNNRPMKLDAISQTQFESQVKNLDEKAKIKAMQTFKEDSLTKLTRQISEEIRPRKEGIQLSIYSWGAHVSNHHRVAQNWKEWIQKEYIDMVCISGYVFEEKYGSNFLSIFKNRMIAAKKIRQESNPSTTLTFCLGLKTSHGQVHQFEELKSYLDIASKAGMDGVVLFHWDGFKKFRKDVTAHHYFENYAQKIKKRNLDSSINPN